MKKIMMLGLCLWPFLFVKGQTITHEYEYDNAGNRVRNVVVQLNNKGGGTNCNQDVSPFTEIMSDTLTMKLYPNPTKESIRFELSDGNKIGAYILSDITGKVIEEGYCEDASLTIDLSNQNGGIYLWKIFIEKKSRTYKIIKQ